MGDNNLKNTTSTIIIDIDDVDISITIDTDDIDNSKITDIEIDNDGVKGSKQKLTDKENFIEIENLNTDRDCFGQQNVNIQFNDYNDIPSDNE